MSDPNLAQRDGAVSAPIQYRNADLLRIATAGSVDDGKSTLVGRLLYDTKSVLADQIDAVTKASVDRGMDTPDLSLLVDGLRAELAASGPFAPGPVVASAHAALREHIPFLDRDRALDAEVATAVRLVAEGTVLEAARSAMGTRS